jgi:hypothetical protein
MAIPVHGEDLYSVTATVNNDKLVTVSGRIGGGPGLPVNILVRDPNGSLEYMNTCLSGAGGIFSISYTMTNTVTGRYDVTVGAEGVANAAATYFLYGKNSLEATAILEDGIVNITGIAGAGAGQLITARIKAPDSTEEYAGCVVSAAGGGFQLSYALTNTRTGKYTVYVGALGIEEPAVCYFLAGIKTEVKAKIDKQKLVTVEGVSVLPGKPVSVRITDPKGITEYLAGVLTKKDGAFAVSYTMVNETKGCYTVSVSAMGLDMPVKTEFCYGSGLAGLALSNCSLDPIFNNETLSYSAIANEDIAFVQVTPTAIDPKAVVSINGNTVTSGTASGNIPLVIGENTITITVTERDKTVTTYVVSVTRKEPDLTPSYTPSNTEPPRLSSNASLSGLVLNDAVLAPLFSSGNLNYTANVSNATASVTVTPTAEDGNATVKVNNIPVVSGSPSSPISLDPGSNTISIVVTAENGTTKTYTVTVNRTVLYNVTVSSLSNGTIQTDPAAAAEGETINLTITPADGWQLKANSLKYNDGADHFIAGTSFVMPASNVTVTAEFEQTASANANLSGLMLIDGNMNSVDLNETFSPETLNYTANVSNSTASVTVTPTVEDVKSTVSVAKNGLESQNVMLGVGNNIITVTVTAEAGNTRTYTITVTRAAPDNAGLLDLAVSTQHPISPAPFDPDRLSPYAYTVSVPNNIVSLQVTAIPVNPADTVEVIAGNMEDDGTINLDVGANNIGIKVTSAIDGSEKSYLLIVTREEISNDATLSSILLSYGIESTPIDFMPEFNMDTTSYTATVEASVSEITVIAERSHSNADMTINGDRIISVPLNDGENIITILVTAEDGSTTKTYTLTVTRLLP